MIRLSLSPRLSAISWLSIEIFTLAGLALLPFSKSAGEICVGIALILWFLRKIPWGEKFPFLPIYSLSYGLFLLLTLLSMVQVPHPLLATAIRGLLKWIKYFGIFFMGVELFRHPKRAARLIGMFLTSMTLVSLNGIYQGWAGVDLVKHYLVNVPASDAGRSPRIMGSFGSPNGLAAFLLLAIPLAFYSWIKEKCLSIKGVLYLSVIFIFLYTFFSTFSRGAFFALVIAAFVYSISRRKLRLFLASLSILVIIILSSSVMRQNYFNSIRWNDISLLERRHYWEVTWKMIQAHPFIGNGVNMYYKKFPAFAPSLETYRGYAHNCYLQMWSEIGIFGLLAFLFPFAAIGYKHFFEPKPPSSAEGQLQDAVSVGILAFLIQSFADTNFYALQPALLFWIFWGFYAALDK